MQAYGTLAAIANALGAKQAMRKFVSSLNSGGKSGVNDSSASAELRRRIQAVINLPKGPIHSR